MWGGWGWIEKKKMSVCSSYRQSISTEATETMNVYVFNGLCGWLVGQLVSYVQSGTSILDYLNLSHSSTAAAAAAAFMTENIFMVFDRKKKKNEYDMIFVFEYDPPKIFPLRFY